MLKSTKLIVTWECLYFSTSIIIILYFKLDSSLPFLTGFPVQDCSFLSTNIVTLKQEDINHSHGSVPCFIQIHFTLNISKHKTRAQNSFSKEKGPIRKTYTLILPLYNSMLQKKTRKIKKRKHPHQIIKHMVSFKSRNKAKKILAEFTNSKISHLPILALLIMETSYPMSIVPFSSNS